MTTAAAPKVRMVRARWRNTSSPSFSEIEFTMPFPWRHLRPASMTSHFDESIMKGTFATSGSVASSSRKRLIAATPSIIPSSMQMSITLAPFSTCCRATLTASSYLPSLISLANFGEPATFVRSPIIMKTPGCCTKGCEPDSSSGFGSGTATEGRSTSSSLGASVGSTRRGSASRARAMAAMCSGVFPQQPPAMLIRPPSAKPRRWRAMSAGSRSKPVGESGFGSPAFG
jgi:hypothetical protein